MTTAEGFICEAINIDGTMWCGRCDLSFPAGSTSTRCKPAAECGLTVSAILAALDDEATRIDGSTEAAAKLTAQWIAEGRQVERGPSRARLRRSAELRAAVRAIETLRAGGKGNG